MRLKVMMNNIIFLVRDILVISGNLGNLRNNLCRKFRSIKPANIYLLKSNNRNTRIRCEVCSKLTVNEPERRNDVVLVFLLLTSNIFHTFL